VQGDGGKKNEGEGRGERRVGIVKGCLLLKNGGLVTPLIAVSVSMHYIH